MAEPIRDRRLHQREQIDHELALLAESLKKAATRGVFFGRFTESEKRYLASCTRRRPTLGLSVIFTRDAGHHTSGWMKNPEFERCQHLSIAPLWQSYGALSVARFERQLLRAFFGDDAPKTWLESAKSPEGITAGVRHWRLFCDASWSPIHPRGEVYSTELTGLGWKTASELGVAIESVLTP